VGRRGRERHTHTHLKANHRDLAARIDTITHNTDRLRQAGNDPR
jgi:hypothetical protein